MYSRYLNEDVEQQAKEASENDPNAPDFEKPIPIRYEYENLNLNNLKNLLTGDKYFYPIVWGGKDSDEWVRTHVCPLDEWENRSRVKDGLLCKYNIGLDTGDLYVITFDKTWWNENP